MATPTFELHTTNSAVLNDVLLAVVQILQTDAYSSLLYLGSIIGFVVVILSYAIPTGKGKVGFFAIAVFIAFLGNSIKANVGLVDRLTGATYIVNDAPMILILPYWLIGTVGTSLSDLSKVYLSVPSAVDLSDGIGYGTALIATMQNVQWSKADSNIAVPAGGSTSNVSVKSTVNAYIESCYRKYGKNVKREAEMSLVLYADSTQVSTTAEVWELFEVEINSNAMSSLKGTALPINTACDDLYTELLAVFKSDEWQDAIIDDFASTYMNISDVMSRPGYASAAGSGASQTAQYLGKIKTDIKAYIGLLFGLTSNSRDAVATMLLMDYLSKALNGNMSQQGHLQSLNSAGRVGSAMVDATNQRNIQMAAEGDFFTRYAGQMTRFFEFIAYIWIPVVLIMLLINPSASGSKQLTTLFMIYAWIQLWPFSFNIINYFQVATTVDAMAGAINGSVNMHEITNAWAQAQRAYASSQFFLGMLPLLTMALLTGNAMSLSRISERVGGEETLDEKRVFRDTEKSSALTNITATADRATDQDGNVMSEDIKTQGAISGAISNGLQAQATRQTSRANSATTRASESLNELVQDSVSAGNSTQVMTANQKSIGISEDLNKTSLKDLKTGDTETAQKMDSLAESLSGSLGLPKNVVLGGMLGLNAGMTKEQRETISTATSKSGISSEAAASVISSAQKFTATDSLNESGMEGHTEQLAYSKQVGSSLEVAKQASAQAAQAKSRTNSTTFQEGITTTKLSEATGSVMDDINKSHDAFIEGNETSPAYLEAMQYAEKFGGKEDFMKLADKVTGTDDGLNIEHQKLAKGHILNSSGLSGKAQNNLARFYSLREAMPAGMGDDLVWDKMGNSGRKAVDNQYVQDSKELDESFNQVTADQPEFSEIEGVVENAENAGYRANNITSEVDPTLSDTDQKTADKLRNQGGQAKSRVKEDLKTGESLRQNVVRNLLANKHSDATEQGSKEALLDSDNVTGGNWHAGNHYGKAIQQHELGKRVESTYANAYNNHQENIDKGLSPQQADTLRIGELSELLGPDQTDQYRESYSNFNRQLMRDDRQWDDNAYAQFNELPEISNIRAEMQHSGVVTDFDTNKIMADGVDPNKQVDTVDRAVDFLGAVFGLSEDNSQSINQQIEKQDKVEQMKQGIVNNPNSHYTEASYQSTEVFKSALEGLQTIRGGETLKDVDLVAAEIAAYQPYAAADKKSSEYNAFVSELTDELYTRNGTIEGLAPVVEEAFENSDFAEYRELATDRFADTKAELEQRENDKGTAASNNGSALKY